MDLLPPTGLRGHQLSKIRWMPFARQFLLKAWMWEPRSGCVWTLCQSESFHTEVLCEVQKEEDSLQACVSVAARIVLRIPVLMLCLCDLRHVSLNSARR